jgi:hypothetical protein
MSEIIRITMQINKINSEAWACERNIPSSDRRLSAKLMPTFVDIRCVAYSSYLIMTSQHMKCN